MRQTNKWDKMEHTPTPWQLHLVSEDVLKPMMKRGYSKGTAVANVELLVRAVNSHDELVNTVKDLLYYSKVTDNQRSKAEQALAKAEGKN